MHCFVLLGVSFIQLKLNRVRAKQCYSISEFRFSDQEFADAKAAVIRGQSPNYTQAHTVVLGKQVQKKKSLRTLTILTIVVGGFFILMILNYIYPKTRGGNGGLITTVNCPAARNPCHV